LSAEDEATAASVGAELSAFCVRPQLPASEEEKKKRKQTVKIKICSCSSQLEVFNDYYTAKDSNFAPHENFPHFFARTVAPLCVSGAQKMNSNKFAGTNFFQTTITYIFL
jgi:hypothetical protein